MRRHLGAQVGLVGLGDLARRAGWPPRRERRAGGDALRPAALGALADAEGAFDLSRAQTGITGPEQPFAEVEGVGARHAR